MRELIIHLEVDRHVEGPIFVAADSYHKCRESVNIEPYSIDSDHPGTASCKTKGTGECMFEDSKFGIELHREGGHPGDLGFLHFYESNSGHWYLKDVSAQGGVTLRTVEASHGGSTDTYRIAIENAVPASVQ